MKLNWNLFCVFYLSNSFAPDGIWLIPFLGIISETVVSLIYFQCVISVSLKSFIIKINNHGPTKVKHDKRGQLNPNISPLNMNVTTQNNVSKQHCDSSPETGKDTNNARDQPATSLPFLSTQWSDTALQEMIALQTKQAELTAMIAEQQRRQFY